MVWTTNNVMFTHEITFMIQIYSDTTDYLLKLKKTQDIVKKSENTKSQIKS